MNQTFDCLQEAWRNTVTEVLAGDKVEGISDGSSVGSFFGQKTRDTLELIGYSFSISNPRARKVDSEVYKVDHALCLANLLWVLSGSSSVAQIDFYNNAGNTFAIDGKMTTAFGYRMFAGEHDQPFISALQRIKNDPNTRRSIISIGMPGDSARCLRDFPCANSIQFLQRNGRLECIVYMRSQSALKLLPHDIHLFTSLHEIAACELGYDLGTYRHICGSIHIYEDERELAENLLKEEPIHVESLAPMNQSPIPILDDLLNLESNIRDPRKKKLSVKIGPYWRNVIKEIESLAKQKSIRKISA